MLNKIKRFALYPNIHFWQWVNDGWVKITLKPGQSLGHYHWTRTDEGWSSTTQIWELSKDGTVLTREVIDDGRDCDGRLTQNWVDEFETTTGAYRPCLVYMNGDILLCGYFVRPVFNVVSSGQRDEYAEAAGY